MIQGLSAIWPKRLPGWAPAFAFLLLFAVVGPVLGGAARPLFVIGCMAIGWQAWRQGPTTHVQATLFLFVFAPFLRRIVDLSAGYEPAGIMLVGPLAAMVPPFLDIIAAIDNREARRHMGPLLAVFVTVVYAALLTIFQGSWLDLARDGIKWLIPLFYGVVLMNSADADEVLDGLADAFCIILPIAGIYGIVQYVDPQAWDRYWMENAPILSIGEPVPYGVRVFSTMNSPATFATYISIGLLLLWFRRRDWLIQILSIPAALALFLSLFRTAWVSMAAAMMFCLLFRSTRSRTIPLIAGVILATIVAATLTPFGDVITERLATFGEGAQDSSAQERFLEYVTLWNAPMSTLIGVGFMTTDVGVAGAMAIDGMVIACWLSMGIIGGLMCLFGICWAAGTVIYTAFRDRDETIVILAALALYFIVQLPLTGITEGEAGFLFWTFVVLGLVPPKPQVMQYDGDLEDEDNFIGDDEGFYPYVESPARRIGY
ncbi:MAG TPA: O-antigen ligase domain-containing protein [Methylovirgula sp.]|nr:O-antigen ligase domain-containing protein [Methylovirgula sp.]